MVPDVRANTHFPRNVLCDGVRVFQRLNCVSNCAPRYLTSIKINLPLSCRLLNFNPGYLLKAILESKKRLFKFNVPMESTCLLKIVL